MSRHCCRLSHRLPLAVVASALFVTFDPNISGAATIPVGDCTDGIGPNTLRHTMEAAPSGSAIEIPLVCSKITLAGASLSVSLGEQLTVMGQGHALTTIDGGSNNSSAPRSDRIFHSEGSLTLKGMTVTHAVNASDDDPRGGCVYSRYNLSLDDVLVTGCALLPAPGAGEARGGGIYTAHDLLLENSAVTGNVVIAAPGSNGEGGGVFAQRDVLTIYSTISNNVALSSPGGGFTRGGGLYAYGNSSVFLINSTISGNISDLGSGMQVSSGRYSGNIVDILNSTVANNTSLLFSAIFTDLPTFITNSTVAFNHSESAGNEDSFPGVYSSQQITMNNSIFANNTVASGLNIDVFSSALSNPLGGSNNLITETTNSVPFGTISTCPKLGHLSNNGGLTQTISLLSNSPALNVGAANGQTTDQRGTGFPRTIGPATDIGAYERQAGVIDDVIFFSEFDSRCN